MFIKLITELEYGQAVCDFDEAVRTVIAAVSEHQKPGALTIKLKFVPQGMGDQVTVEDSYKVERPERDRMKTIMYVQRDGGLSRRDPRQPELPLAETLAEEAALD